MIGEERQHMMISTMNTINPVWSGMRSSEDVMGGFLFAVLFAVDAWAYVNASDVFDDDELKLLFDTGSLQEPLQESPMSSSIGVEI